MVSLSSKDKALRGSRTVPCPDIDIRVFGSVFAQALYQKINVRLYETFLSSQSLVAESVR